jgi:hypothetical protein
VTLGSISPGVQVGSGNPLTDLQLFAGPSGGRLSVALLDNVDACGGGGAVGLANAVVCFAHPTLSKTAVKTRTALFVRIVTMESCAPESDAPWSPNGSVFLDLTFYCPALATPAAATGLSMDNPLTAIFPEDPRPPAA